MSFGGKVRFSNLRDLLCSASVKVILELLKANHDDGDIIHGLLFRCQSQDLIGTFPTNLMQIDIWIILILLDNIPNQHTDLLSAEFVEYAIAAENDEI